MKIPKSKRDISGFSLLKLKRLELLMGKDKFWFANT